MSNIIIEVQNTTPLMAGWYEPQLVDPIGLRATEIKGLWRWWARAFVGGALYDLGYLKGRHAPNIYLRPSKEDVNRISEIVGLKLGLGYAGERGSHVSRFKIYVEPASGVVKRYVDEEYMRRYMRMKLLGMRERREKEEKEKGREEPVPELISQGAKFKIRIEASPANPRISDIALRILIIGLQLMGIGKAARRGLGSLDILDIRGFSVEKNLAKVIDETYSEVREVVKEKLSKLQEPPGSLDSLPPIPVVSKAKIKDLHVAQVYRVPENVSYEQVHNFFLRAERTRILEVRQDDLRRNCQAWILGLPRGVKRRGEIVSGYHIEVEEVARRASPFTLGFHTEQNLFGKGTYVAVFLSGDWPTKIAWYQKRQEEQPIAARKRKPITIQNDDVIIEALRTAIREFEDYVNRVARQRPSIIWPRQ